MIATDFLHYALHYVILRTLYNGSRAAGVSPWVLVGFAVVMLVLLHFMGRGGMRRWERRQERPGRAYRVERAKQEARRDAKEAEKTRGRWRF